MKILIALSVVVAILLVYALWGRDWLKSKTWAQPFFDWIEPIEILLFKKSPTILFARLKVVTGLVLTYLTSIGGIDLSGVTPFVPEKYQSWVNGAINLLPLVISIVGWTDEYLRKKTTLPIELVSVKEKDMPPAVADALVAADAAKTDAVVAVELSKAA